MTARTRAELATASRIVVKVGSSSISGESSWRIPVIVDALAAAHARGAEVVLVSSGAIASGIPFLRLDARPTDLVVDDDGTVVVNATHAGMSAAASARSGDLKARLGPAAYPVAAFLEGIGDVGFRGTVVADGVTLVADEDLLLVGVGNGQSIGGGTPLFPDARLDDGLLEVLVACTTGPLARVGFAARLRSGDHVDRDDVVTTRAREVTIRGEAVPHCLDGEVSDPVAARTYRVEAGALRLVRPPTP